MKNSARFTYVDGRRPLPPALSEKIVGLLKRTGRPMTTYEIAAELNYSRDHIKYHTVTMAAKCLLTEWKEWHLPNVYGLPSWIGVSLAVDPIEPSKQCPKCERVLPLSDFGADRNQPSGRTSRCRWCRSPRTDKTRVSRYPARGNGPRKGVTVNA